MDKRLRFMTGLIAPLKVEPGSEVRLSRDHDPATRAAWPARPGRAAAPLWSPLDPPALATAERAAKALRKDSPDIRWHAVRIRAKRCCYAAEAVHRSAAGRAAIAAVQAILGDHQDTVMAGAWLRATGAAVLRHASPPAS